MSTRRLGTVLVFGNLNVACLDENGHQIGELQECLLFTWANWAEARGYTVHNLKVQTAKGTWRLIKTKTGWRREVVYG